MTDDDHDIANFTTTIEPTPAPKPKPKRTRLYRKRAAALSRAALPDEYAGVTGTDCPIACHAKRCVITHTGHCGHPRKGALFSEEQMNPAILKRWNAVRKILAMASTAKRFKDDE
jgi:hypothetical protein